MRYRFRAPLGLPVITRAVATFTVATTVLLSNSAGASVDDASPSSTPTTTPAGTAPKPASARRDAPSVKEARAAVRAAEADLALAQSNRDTYRAQLDSMAASSAIVVDQLSEARTQLRERAVAAFIDGDRPETVLALLGDENLFDASARVNLTRNSAKQTSNIVRKYQRLKAQADPELARVAEAVQQAEQKLAEANDAALAARAQERDAERRRDRAIEAREAAAATAAAQQAADSTTTSAEPPTFPGGPPTTRPSKAVVVTTPVTAQPSTTTAPPATAPTAPSPTPPTTTVPPAPPTTAPSPPTTAPTGGPSEQQWYRLRMCESTNNYQAVNRSGKYRGAYQFDLKTWATLGSPGDPAAAPPAEQDRRAKLLYSRRGWKPWPECGRHLW